ncbi:MAG TPA: DUF1697 domain-containing protein [Candidatus Saccharimonadales bacterium]|nr:DUF1697 domain-containing protein [Candidatus Saccharimonadales bacterium]
MTQYIAFIRGINAGLTLKMEALRGLFEDAGYKDVQTVLATGNVIFESSEDRQKIIHTVQQEFDKKYGYKTIVVLYSKQELQKLLKAVPFKGMTKTIETSQQVSFVAKEAELPFTLPFSRPEKGYTILEKIGNVLCSTVDLSGKTRPDILALLDRVFGGNVTTRNWQTVERCYKTMDN